VPHAWACSGASVMNLLNASLIKLGSVLIFSPDVDVDNR